MTLFELAAVVITLAPVVLALYLGGSYLRWRSDDEWRRQERMFKRGLR